jgi:outer membrane receptor for ferrienterochelin and colicins
VKEFKHSQKMKTKMKMTMHLPRIVLLIIILSPFGLSAQCENVLRTAQKQYVEGNFELLLSTLEPCLPALSEKDRVIALRFKAIALLATDQFIQANTAVEELILLNPTYEPNDVDNPLAFERLVKDVKSRGATEKVSSVSKKEEDLNKAPATVLVVDAKQIQNRGYVDVEEILHDLPGFDISRTNGITYSSIYQRGYRNFNNNDRSLLLIDGYEMNDIWLNGIFLSRQIPLSNIKRFEVIHGPASTMYGSNAFSGTLNIVTKTVSDIIPVGKNYGANAQFSYGSFQSKMADATIATRNGQFSAIFTARVFHSNESDLSGYSDWDFKPAQIQFYDTLSWKMTPSLFLEKKLYNHGGIIQWNSDTTNISVTQAGASAARFKDSTAYSSLVNGHPVGSMDRTRDYYLSANFRLANYNFGVIYFNNNEGTSYQTDKSKAGYDNGNRWCPRQLLLFSRYDKPFNDNASFTNITSYKQSDIGPQTALVSPFTFENRRLNYDSLIQNVNPFWRTVRFNQFCAQMRNETRFYYAPNRKIDAFAGFDLRYGTIQGDYITSRGQVPAADSGAAPVVPGGNTYKVFDSGLFSQISYTPFKDLKIVGGGRLDHNIVRTTSGYGTVFNPRFVLVYSPKKTISKLIYSEAFVGASSFDKYSTVKGTRDISNPNLKPEKVRNVEASIGQSLKIVNAWSLFLEGGGFYSNFSDVIATVRVKQGGVDLGQNQSIGKMSVYGGQVVANLQYSDRLSFVFNYSYTQPWNTPVDSIGVPQKDSTKLRIADIATHKFNLIANVMLQKSLNFNVRINYSGARKVGIGTTVPTNNYPGGYIPAFLIANASLSWNLAHTGITLQGTMNNVLNAQYGVPGARTADGTDFANYIPQPGRTVSLKLIYDLHQAPIK